MAAGQGDGRPPGPQAGQFSVDELLMDLAEPPAGRSPEQRIAAILFRVQGQSTPFVAPVRASRRVAVGLRVAAGVGLLGVGLGLGVAVSEWRPAESPSPVATAPSSLAGEELFATLAEIYAEGLAGSVEETAPEAEQTR